MTGNPDEKTVASCVIVTFKHIKRTHRLYGVGVINDFGFPFTPSCIIYLVPINRFGGRSRTFVYPINPEPTARLERYRDAWLIKKWAKNLETIRAIVEKIK